MMAKVDERGEGILFMAALAQQSAADLAHTTNMLHQTALEQVISIGEQFLLVWDRIDAAQQKGSPRAVDKALGMADTYGVAQTVEHAKELLAKYKEAGL